MSKIRMAPVLETWNEVDCNKAADGTLLPVLDAGGFQCGRGLGLALSASQLSRYSLPVDSDRNYGLPDAISILGLMLPKLSNSYRVMTKLRAIGLSHE
jgi:hypothetical protein